MKKIKFRLKSIAMRIVYLSAFFFTFLMQSFANDSINVKFSFPEKVFPNTEYTAFIYLHKSDLQCFLNLQQELPEGFHIYSPEADEADFSVQKQKITFTWMKLPLDSTIKVSYKFEVDENIRGTFPIKTECSYIKDSQIKIIRPNSFVIAVADSGNTAKAESNKLAPQSFAASGKTVSCSRSISRKQDTKASYIVSLEIDKGDIAGAGKLSEKIPAAYKVTKDKTGNAEFSFVNDNEVIFKWKNLPADNKFSISYVLTPNDLENSTLPYIRGKFYYLNNNHNFFTKVVMKKQVVKNKAKTENKIKIEDKTKIENNAKDSTQNNKNETKLPIDKQLDFTLNNEPPISIFSASGTIGKIIKTKQKKIDSQTNIYEKKTRKKITQHQEKKSKAQINTYKGKTEKKITQHKKKKSTTIKKSQKKPHRTKKQLSYRIQIFVSSEYVAPDFFEKYRVKGVVMCEKAGKSYKYMLGKFKDRKSAERFQTELMQKTLLPESQIIVYNFDKRITSSEEQRIIKK